MAMVSVPCPLGCGSKLDVPVTISVSPFWRGQVAVQATPLPDAVEAVADLHRDLWHAEDR